ncbi:hypothetical protein STRA110950_03925 [Streptobacillus ratti]
MPLIKVALGTKISDKYNVALFGGYGTKGVIGIESGYTF